MQKVKGTGTKIGPLQESILVQLLASGVSQKEAAAQIGVCPNTIYKRMRKPEFKAKVTEANVKLTSTLMEQAKAGVMSLTMKAREKLEAILDDDDVAPQTKLGAVRTVYEYALKFAEATTVTEKLDSLEGHVDEIKTRAEELTSVTAAA